MTDYDPPEELQPPLDISYHYSTTSKLRQPSPIKSFYKYFQIPGIGNLAGGLPNNNYFPFDTLESVAALPDRFVPTPTKPVDPPADLKVANNGNEAAASRVVVPKVSSNSDLLRKIDLKTALQYGQAQGYPPLYAWIRQFTREHLHPNVPYKNGPEIVMTVGNTDGFAKTIESLVNVWREGEDPISEKQGMLVEEFFYAPPSVTVKPFGVNVVPVGVDDDGMRATGKGGLEDVLENWDHSKGKRPHIMYTVTMGQNPTGALLSVERRKAIYALCVKYDVLIIEDDPYWYLQYPSATSDSLSTNYNTPRSSGFPFLDSLIPSYLSVDYQGRVIRLDTFSKTVAPGCRLGWITAQPDLIGKILLYTQTCTQQPSGFVQAMIAQLVMGSSETPIASTPSLLPSLFGGNTVNLASTQSGWQVAGWVRWLEGLRGNYERRMQTMCRIFEEGKYLVKTTRRRSLDAELADLTLSSNTDAEEGSKPALSTPQPSEDEDWRLVTRTPLYNFQWPRAGMFLWLELDMSSHPLAARASKPPTVSISPSPNFFFGPRQFKFKSNSPTTPSSTSSSSLASALRPSSHIYQRTPKLPQRTLAKAIWVFLTQPEYLVLVSPGEMFSGSKEIAEEKGWKYFRLCFAAVDDDELEGTCRRFVKGVHDFWGVKDAEKVRKWAEDGYGKVMWEEMMKGAGEGTDGELEL